MDHQQALRELRRGARDERLEAARFLISHATSSDLTRLNRAREREPDAYVTVALDDAIRHAAERENESASTAFEPAIDERQAEADVYAEAVEDTSQMIVHELRRFVGLTRVAARSEIDDFDASETKARFDRLGSLMEAVERLGSAAATPSFEEFDLAGLVLDVRSTEAERFGLRVDHTGTSPLIVVGDPGLVELAVRNGLVNACESVSAGPPEEQRPIVLTWGSTERDTWVAVLDRGDGLPEELVDPFAFAQSGKPEHLGVGLALAERAVATLNGVIDLTPRDGGGVSYLLRWPRTGSQ